LSNFLNQTTEVTKWWHCEENVIHVYWVSLHVIVW